MLSPGVRNILISTLYFAMMNTMVKYLQHIPSVQIVWFRSLVTLLISLYLIRKNHLHPLGNNRKLLLARGVAGACALLCYFYSLQHMPLASAVTIQYMAPLFTVVLASILLKERVGAAAWILLAICMVGVGLIKGFDPRIDNYTLMVGIAAALFSGIAYNIVRKLKDSDSPFIIVFYFPLVTFPVVTPVMLYQWVTPEGWDWLLLLGVGVCTQFGQIHLTKAYMMEPASKVAGLSYTGLIFAIAFGYILFGEELNTMTVLGILLIIGAIVTQVYLDYEGGKASKRT